MKWNKEETQKNESHISLHARTKGKPKCKQSHDDYGSGEMWRGKLRKRRLINAHSVHAEKFVVPTEHHYYMQLI